VTIATEKTWNQAQVDNAANILAELREANLSARAQFSMYSPLGSDKSVTNAVIYLIDSSGAAIEKLAKQLEAKSLTYNSWRISADAQRGVYDGKGNVFNVMESSSPTFSRFWNEVIAETASDVVVLTKETAAKAESGFPFLVVALVAVAVIVVFK